MKKKLAVMLVLVLIVSMMSGLSLQADDNGENGNGAEAIAEIVAYQMVVEGFDWGPAVTRLIVELGDAVDADDVIPGDFSVSFTREPGFRAAMDDEFDVVQQDAHVVNAFISDENGVAANEPSTFITLELEVHPGRGINPFTFVLSPMGNNWADPFETTITWGESFAPTRTARIAPLTDLFDLDGVFNYDDITLQYGSFVPAQAATSNRPLIIWLHGGGEGSRNLTAAPDVAILGNRVTQLVAPEIQGLMGGAHVLLPQATTMWFAGSADNDGESHYEAALLALIDYYLENTPGIDLNRIYIGGCSNGGYMTMRMLFARPDMFAAAWPVCLGYREEWLTDDKIESIVDVPIWMVHDINDPVAGTPHADSQRILDMLITAGALNVHLTTTDGLYSDEFYDEYGEPWAFNLHWSWIPALNNAVSEEMDGANVSLFQWMAAQSLAGEVVEPDPEDDPVDEPIDEPIDEPAPIVTTLRLVMDSPTYTINEVEATTIDSFIPFIDPDSYAAMVSLRMVVEAFGATVAWDGDAGRVTVVRGDVEVILYIDQELPDGMGMPILLNERIFVPARYISVAFGFETAWDGDARAVYITA